MVGRHNSDGEGSIPSCGSNPIRTFVLTRTTRSNLERRGGVRDSNAAIRLEPRARTSRSNTAVKSCSHDSIPSCGSNPTRTYFRTRTSLPRVARRGSVASDGPLVVPLDAYIMCDKRARKWGGVACEISAPVSLWRAATRALRSPSRARPVRVFVRPVALIFKMVVPTSAPL